MHRFHCPARVRRPTCLTARAGRLPEAPHAADPAGVCGVGYRPVLRHRSKRTGRGRAIRAILVSSKKDFNIALACCRRFVRNPHGSAICACRLARTRMKWRSWRCAACRCPFHAVPGAVGYSAAALLKPGAGTRTTSTTRYDADDRIGHWPARPARVWARPAQRGLTPSGWRRSAAAATRCVPSGRRHLAAAARVRRRGCGRCDRRSPGPGPIPWRRCGRRRAA